MVVDVQQRFCFHNLGHQTYTVKGAGINNYQQIRLQLAALYRAFTQFNTGKKAKAFVDNIITENSNLLALCQQKTRQSQSGAQGVTIRAYMGTQHNFFCRQQHSACFLQAKLLTHALLPRLQAFLPA